MIRLGLNAKPTRTGYKRPVKTTMMTLGVIADTHIPERARGLNPGVLPAFQRAEVKAILHAGDVCIPRVLEELGELAPVYAVRGNRDWAYLKHLPTSLSLDFGGVAVGLIHGHGRWRNYLVDRTSYFLEGFRFERYQPRLLAAFPTARVIVFGHMHIPFNHWVGDQLLFTPGTACCPAEKTTPPSLGLLHIHAGGEIVGEIISLE